MPAAAAARSTAPQGRTPVVVFFGICVMTMHMQVYFGLTDLMMMDITPSLGHNTVTSSWYLLESSVVMGMVPPPPAVPLLERIRAQGIRVGDFVPLGGWSAVVAVTRGGIGMLLLLLWGRRAGLFRIIGGGGGGSSSSGRAACVPLPCSCWRGGSSSSGGCPRGAQLGG